MPICTAVKALAACVLLASLTIPGHSHADAERPLRDAGSSPGRFIEEEYAERLGLEAETLAAIHKIVETVRLQSRPLWRELHQAHTQMRLLLSQETPDPAAVMRQADTIGALELAERKNRLQAMLQIRAILTPAQRQELVRLQGELATRGRSEGLHACQDDSAKLCSDATPGRVRLQCLRDHLEALSETCRAVIQRPRGERPGP